MDDPWYGSCQAISRFQGVFRDVRQPKIYFNLGGIPCLGRS